MSLKSRILVAFVTLVLAASPAAGGTPCLLDCLGASSVSPVKQAASSAASPVNAVQGSHCQGSPAPSISKFSCGPHSPDAVQSQVYISSHLQKAGPADGDLEAANFSLATKTASLSLAESRGRSHPPILKVSLSASLRI